MLGDQNILLKNPDLVAQDGWLALSSAFWFYMTPGTPKPSAHDVIVGHWKPNAADIASGNTAGFGAIINIVNGGVECGKGSLSPTTQSRVQHYRDFTTAL